MAKCPVCRQPLPNGIDIRALQSRLEEITARGRAKERRALERDFRKRVMGAVEAERVRLRRSAEQEVRSELLRAKAMVEQVERDKNREIVQLRRDAERKAERRAEMAAKMAARQNRAQIEDIEAKRERDRARYEADRARLQNQLDQLSRKLDKQVADQLGKEAEIDLLTELNKAFQTDRINPVRRGVKGADIIHDIIEDGKRLGRIVYESKNVSNWSNKFIAQAKQYQTQYETPHVIVVSRCFPQKKKGLCTLKNIPVVDPRMAVCLASIIRDGIREIGLARITRTGRNEKAQQLYEYILSDKFVTRFREIAESVESLRERQRKERDSHEDSWDEQSHLYDKIDNRRREVDSQIRTIVKQSGKPEIVRLAAKG